MAALPPVSMGNVSSQATEADKAIANLPDLTQPSSQKQRAIATGTDKVLPSDWTHTGQTCAQQRLLANNSEQKNHSNDSETTVLNTPAAIRTRDLRIRNDIRQFCKPFNSKNLYRITH